jgi:hypothetical protein
MTILTWKLSAAPAQIPEYWLLCVDGFACTALTLQAPYTGLGNYSVDLTKLDPQAPMPTDGAAHNYSVALVGSGVIGPQSAAVSITLPLPVVTIVTTQLPPPPVWPAADTVTST